MQIAVFDRCRGPPGRTFLHPVFSVSLVDIPSVTHACPWPRSISPPLYFKQGTGLSTKLRGKHGFHGKKGCQCLLRP